MANYGVIFCREVKKNYAIANLKFGEDDIRSIVRDAIFLLTSQNLIVMFEITGEKLPKNWFQGFK